MMTLTLLLTVLTVLAWWTSRNRRAAIASMPTRVTRWVDPRTQGASLSPVWQLRHAPDCRSRHGQDLPGRRLALADTVALCVPGKSACNCFYQPLPDQRRRERRQDADRRATLRFEPQRDSRRRPSHSRRRGEQIWQPLQRL